MNFYWEDATKRIQQELHDPLLRVEFNSETQLYEVLKWMPRYQYEKLPGYVFGSDAEIINLGIPSGYWMIQMTFDAWDNRVFEEMRKGRPDRISDKEFFANMKRQKEKVKQSLDNDKRDWDREVIMDMHKVARPTIYSYSKAGV